jgi:hypothetical protein
MDFSVWKTACRFCVRLAETDECNECRDHFERHGHHPNEVRCYQVPGRVGEERAMSGRPVMWWLGSCFAW